jgi:hypothetical protein
MNEAVCIQSKKACYEDGKCCSHQQCHNRPQAAGIIEGQFDTKYVKNNLYPKCGLDLTMDYSPDPRLMAMLLFVQDQKPQPYE